MISHGRVYKFVGARKIDMLLDFAKVGVRLDMDGFPLFPVLRDMLKYDIVYAQRSGLGYLSRRRQKSLPHVQ